MPGPLQAGARGSPHLPARPQPAASRRPRPLTEPGTPGGRRNKRALVPPEDLLALHPTAARARLPPARPARVLPASPGHGELRAAATALGLLRGGRRWVVTLPGPHPPSFALVFCGKGGLRWVLVAAHGIFIASLGIFHYSKWIYTHPLVVALGISVSVLGLSYSTACEFFPHWGLNPHPLYCKADS